MARFAHDLHRATRAVKAATGALHMNVESLGNYVPHLHWHIVPRSPGDPRWGQPIWTSDVAEMPFERLSDDQLHRLAGEILAEL